METLGQGVGVPTEPRLIWGAVKIHGGRNADRICSDRTG